METGKQLWRTAVEAEPGVTRHGITRGAPVLYNGKLFRVTVDNHVVALDMKTGKQVWKQKFAARRRRATTRPAPPMIANGVLISGMSGGESTTAASSTAGTRKPAGSCGGGYTIPAPGEPGSETWPKNSDAWTRGGGPTWRSGSYDPQLDLVHWGTGNAEPYDPRPQRRWTALYTSSHGIRPKTGESSSAISSTRRTTFRDVDATDELVLA